MRKAYKCKKSFTVDVLDDNGFSTHREKVIKEGTLWEYSLEENKGAKEQTKFTKVEDSSKHSEWIVIPSCELEKYFEEYDGLDKCPFCGSYKVHMGSKVVPRTKPSQYVYSVRCNSCKARGPVDRDKEQAVNKWKKRID